MYILKVKKFLVCAYLRLDSVEQNIECDASQNRINIYWPKPWLYHMYFLYPSILSKRVFSPFEEATN